MQGHLASWGGIDWSAVYSGAYYAAASPDVADWATVRTDYFAVLDDAKLLSHFVSSGVAECRQGSPSFSVASYYNGYPDLRRAFGTDWPSYYRHFALSGASEGRAGTGCTEMIVDNSSSIMGVNQATVNQMVTYFNRTGHAFPSSTYAAKGAATIEQFCQIASEEAAAEGVRVEVLFCQAMKETGWLKFTGVVQKEQCNFGGLGATNSDTRGAVFPDVRTGLRAQVQHLKLYGSTAPLSNACVDQRWDDAVRAWGRGSAPYLEDLNGKWAVPGDTYGQDIYRMVQALLAV